MIAVPQMIPNSKWSQDRQWSKTANDPQIGPQMIPGRQMIPEWTTNDSAKTHGIECSFHNRKVKNVWQKKHDRPYLRVHHSLEKNCAQDIGILVSYYTLRVVDVC